MLNISLVKQSVTVYSTYICDTPFECASILECTIAKGRSVRLSVTLMMYA